MTDIDTDQICHAMLIDARVIGCATAGQLGDHLEWLEEIQDNVARAIEKARRKEAA